ALLNHADKTAIWPAFDESAASRRTVYAFIKRSMLVPFLEVLDLCDVTQTSPLRKVTTVPTQALTLFNGDFIMRQARYFAERLIREAPNAEDRFRLAFRLAIARPPTDEELDAVTEYADRQYEEFRNDPKHRDAAEDELQRHVLTQLCRVILNLNEFVYPE
ncbi:MAG: DUF1553 domain-containing protein, partial [Fuerstiella sp.]|nr:DUF1553 domain-containing protein [Fuerstiella sp.]